MRKLVLLALFFPACVLSFGQDAKFFAAESDHYAVASESSQSQAVEVSRIMEGCLALYNGIFHFDLSRLPGKLHVRVFKDVDSFNAHLQKLISQTRADFVFVSYSDPEKSELLAFTKEDEKGFISSLVHQGCIQFTKAFVDYPPVWLREGVATYLDASVWDSRTGAFAFEPNFIWLDSLKAIMRGESASRLMPITDLLTVTREAAQGQLDVFYPEAWGLVAFLTGSTAKADNRILWDSIGSLDAKASLGENSQYVRRRAFSWVDERALSGGFQSYILSLKTAQDHLRDGVDLYGKGDLDQAEKSFLAALDLEPDANVAWYYLGLISYARKDYPKAEEMYVKAFQLGMGSGLINYALGVNAFASAKYAEAAKYLKLAKDSEPAAYGEKAEALLKRINTLN